LPDVVPRSPPDAESDSLADDSRSADLCSVVGRAATAVLATAVLATVVAMAVLAMAVLAPVPAAASEVDDSPPAPS